jgi:hypothetical protein
MELKKIYQLLYPEYFKFDSLKNLLILINQIVFYIVSVGCGTLLTILLYSLNEYAVTPFEQITSLILIFFLVLLWVGIMFIMKGIFIIFNITLYLTLFIQNNSYYPYVTLIMMISLCVPLLYERFNPKFALRVR